MFEYTKREDRHIEFHSPSGEYHVLDVHYQDVTLFIKEELNKKFLVISIFNKQISRIDRLISNVELELHTDIIPNMDTYKIRDWYLAHQSL